VVVFFSASVGHGMVSTSLAPSLTPPWPARATLAGAFISRGGEPPEDRGKGDSCWLVRHRYGLVISPMVKPSAGNEHDGHDRALS